MVSALNVTKVRMKIRTLGDMVRILFEKANLNTLSIATSLFQVRNLKTAFFQSRKNGGGYFWRRSLLKK